MEVELLVGARHYYVSLDRIKAFPDSYFAVALSPQWQEQNEGSNKTLRIEGCKHSELFEHIVHYVQHGCVARNREGDCLIDRSLLPSLREDADYFCLSGMVSEIDALMTSDTPMLNKINNALTYWSKVDGGSHLGYDVKSHRDQLKFFDGSPTFGSAPVDCFKQLIDGFSEGQYGPSFSFYGVQFEQSVLTMNPALTEEVEMVAKRAKICSSLKDLLVTHSPQQLHELELRPCLEFIDNIAAEVNKFFENERQHFSLQYQRLVVNTATQMREKVITAAADSTSGCVIVMVAYGQRVLEAVVSQPNSSNDFNIEFANLYLLPDQYCFFVMMREDCKCEFKPFTEGVQLLFIYDIIKVADNLKVVKANDHTTNDEADTKLYLTYSGNHLKSILSTAHNMTQLIQSMLHKLKYIGIYFSEQYSSKGLRAEALIGFDAMLYNALKATGVPISLVYVKCNVIKLNGDYGYIINSVDLFLDCFDTRLNIHKTKEFVSYEIPFVNWNEYGECWQGHDYDAHKYCVSVNDTIYSAMIIGDGHGSGEKLL